MDKAETVAIGVRQHEIAAPRFPGRIPLEGEPSADQVTAEVLDIGLSEGQLDAREIVAALVQMDSAILVLEHRISIHVLVGAPEPERSIERKRSLDVPHDKPQ